MTHTTLEDREDWKRYKDAMKVIAAKFGVPLRCNQKYKYLNVNFGIEGLADDEIAALQALEELVMLVSEFPEGVLQRLDPDSLKAESPFDGH
ncbi:hypothetical protein [Noviherbaspirillum sp.]|mgnify:CR=1 FL=1|uniref:hypothetical protein n=1 Tax=Noviherbaspirillum sp. TaxID=1926288 RepID=UPI002FDF4111